MSKEPPDGSMESPDSGSEKEAVNHEVEATPILPAINGSAEAESNEGAAESDPFAGSAEDHAAKETRRKIELFEWADSVLGLNETELELALDAAVKRFGMSRTALKRIIRARRSEKLKAKAKEERSRAEPKDDENNVKYYSPDFKVSDRGVYARKFDDHGHPFWDRICTTRIDLLALTRDRREENWGTYSSSRIAMEGGRSLQFLTLSPPPTRLRISLACWPRSASESFHQSRLVNSSCSFSRSKSLDALRQFPRSVGIPAAVLGYLCCQTKPSCLLDSMVHSPSSRQRASMSSTASTYPTPSSNGSIRSPLPWQEIVMCIYASAQLLPDPYSSGRVNRPAFFTSGARRR